MLSILAIVNLLMLSVIDVSYFLFLSQGTSIYSLASCFSRFLGTPFFHSMMARAWAFTSDIYVLIDPDTILLPDFIFMLNRAYKINRDWLLVASSHNVSRFPFHLSDDGKQWLTKDGRRVRTHEV